MSESQLAALWKLHEIDQEIRRTEADSASRLAVLAKEKERVAQAESELAAIEGQVKELQVEVDGRQVTLQLVEDAKSKLEDQAGALKTPEEYAAMQKQIAGKDEEISELEDKILETMEVLETANLQISQREAGLEERRRALVTAEGRVKEDCEAFAKKIAERRESWEGVAEGIDSGWVETYRRVREQRDGIGMARIGADRMCQGCNLNVTPQVLNRAMGSLFVHCPKCECILIYG